MKTANQIPANKIRFSHNIPATRRKEEDLYRRMLFLNLIKDESRRLPDIHVASKSLPERKEEAIKEFIISLL